MSTPTLTLRATGAGMALMDAEEAKPETHLRVLLNVGDELRRRFQAK